MEPQPFFFLSIAFSLIAWGLVTVWYIWPALRRRPWVDVLRPLLVAHSFRFVGLAFLVPGVVSPQIPQAFAQLAGFGDIIAAALALLSLALLPRPAGVAVAWIFNIWGTVDLVGAFYQARTAGLDPGQLGAAFFIPTVLVPPLLITHGLIFRLLLQRHGASASLRTQGARV